MTIKSMYHVASSEHRRSISEKGLLASFDSTGYGAVFLADSCPSHRPGFDIWLVRVEGLSLEEDFTGEPDSGRWWMHFGDIESDRLLMLKKILDCDLSLPMP